MTAISRRTYVMAEQRTEESCEARDSTLWQSRVEPTVLRPRRPSGDQSRIPDRVDRTRIEHSSKEACRAFGVRVREARHRLGITQEALGAAIGLTSRGQSHVSRIERGYVNLTIESLVLISESLGFELDIVLRARQDGTVNQAQSE